MILILLTSTGIRGNQILSIGREWKDTFIEECEEQMCAYCQAGVAVIFRNSFRLLDFTSMKTYPVVGVDLSAEQLVNVLELT